MMVRRQFVFMNATLLAGAGLIPFTRIGMAAPQIDARDVQFATGLSQGKFAALVGEPFYLYGILGGMTIAHLVEVTAHESPAGFEQFSLFFHVPAVSPLSEGLYELDHLIAGRTLIYLTPSASRAPPLLYRADFNLKRPIASSSL